MYGSVDMFNHTSHIVDIQQDRIFCTYCWMRDYPCLYKAFFIEKSTKNKEKNTFRHRKKKEPYFEHLKQSFYASYINMT